MSDLPNPAAYEAIIAAFSLISFADGELHTAELSRFIKIMGDEKPFDTVDEDRLMEDVAAFVKVLKKDFEHGKLLALETISKVRNDGVMRDLVLKISRLVLIADNKILESEEAMVAEIHRVLGVTER